MVWREDKYESLCNRGNRQGPGDEVSPALLGQEDFPLPYELIDVDVVERQQKDQQHCRAEQDQARSFVTDQWPHQKRRDKRGEQSNMPVRRESTMDFISKLTEKPGLD